MNPALHPEPESFCSQCGRPEGQTVGDEILCAACHHERGSCGAVSEDDAGPAVVPDL